MDMEPGTVAMALGEEATAMADMQSVVEAVAMDLTMVTDMAATGLEEAETAIGVVDPAMEAMDRKTGTLEHWTG